MLTMVGFPEYLVDLIATTEGCQCGCLSKKSMQTQLVGVYLYTETFHEGHVFVNLVCGTLCHTMTVCQGWHCQTSIR